MFTEPASTRTIADELVISQAAVKQHLANLFDKFAVGTDDANRRLRLANDTIRTRGQLTIADPTGRTYRKHEAKGHGAGHPPQVTFAPSE